MHDRNLLFMCMPALGFAAEIPAWNEIGYYIQDHARILSNEQKEELNRLGKNLEEATGAELAVLTIPSIGDEPVEKYAVEHCGNMDLEKKAKTMVHCLLLRRYRIHLVIGTLSCLSAMASKAHCQTGKSEGSWMKSQCRI